MDDFFTWINSELKRRGWSQSELARRMGISRAAVSAVFNGTNALTWEFCFSMARAFGIPPETVFRRAGLLPATPNPNRVQDLLDVARSLSPDNLDLLVDLGMTIHQRQKDVETDGR